jgi:hypothetical protein
MGFDLTNQNISDTFQNLLQTTGSNGEVYDLEGNQVTNLNINTISSSVVTASVLEIPSGDNLTGNKLHSRGGTLYFGGTNLETGGSGLSNILEDTTPQLGGNLDLNGNQISGSGKIEVTTANTNDFFLLKSGSLESLKVNGQGVTVLGGFTFEPTAVKGGVYYNDTDDEFYAGKQN